jgi:hypothetical protein
VLRKFRKLHDIRPHSFYLSYNVIRMIKSERLNVVGYVVHIWETRKCIKLWVVEVRN